MTKLLLKLFVRDHRNTENPAVRSAIGSLAGTAGLVCNCLLALGKLLAGILAGSVAVIADGLNNLTDGASSVVTLVGFRLARRPADADHPYGHARYEYLSGLVVSVLILFIGWELASSSVAKILHPEPVAASVLTFGVLAASILLKLWMTVFFTKLGKTIHSGALRAAATDSRNDVIATTAVLLGCGISRVLQVNVDGFVGLAVALFILYSGVRVANETISPLLGQQADPELVEKLTRLVLSHEPVLGVHDLLIHDYGPGQCYASLHAEISGQEDPLVCHDIIDDIECDALEKLNVHLVIHYDPVLLDDAECNALRRMVRQIVEDISPRLSMHDFRLVRGASQKKLVFDLAVPYDMSVPGKELKQRIEDALAEAGCSCQTVIRFDRK